MFNFYSSGNVKKAVIAAIAIIIFGAVFILSRLSIPDTSPKPLSPEEIMAGQRAELDRLRKETPPLTQEEIKNQKKELDKLRKEGLANQLSPEETDKQKEELDKLRLQSNQQLY